MATKRAVKQGGRSRSFPRFSGNIGKRKLIECLRSQTLVSNDVKLAKSLEKSGKLHKFQKDDLLIQQGDPSNDILLIVHGEVSIQVNGRAVATRQAGTHVGEMALVDSLATRSASALALGPTVALKVPEHKFSTIANQYPDLWRRVAVEIASRLRERNKALKQPHAEPVLFIGSSSKGLNVVNALHSNLSRHRVIPRPWTEGVFEASRTTIENLVALTGEADFAALVLSADDVTVSHGKKKPSPRDNIVFELGLLMGALGRERVFILKPKNIDIRIPTDLLGLTWLDYRKGGPGNLRAKLRTATTAILKRIDNLGPR